MFPWEIWTYEFPIEGKHPCVIFSHQGRLTNSNFDRVNVFLCRTLRGNLQRELKFSEVILDREDGLEWETLCRVDCLHFIPKIGLKEKRGIVCKERRRIISQRLLHLFPFEF